jgi:Protein of unknown function (DUF5818)
MPSCDPVHATGVLERSDDGVVLLVAGGGSWSLDDHRDVAALLGRQVEVEGWRSGFNAIACERVWPVGKPPPRRRQAVRLEFALIAGLVILGCSVQLLALFA